MEEVLQRMGIYIPKIQKGQGDHDREKKLGVFVEDNVGSGVRSIGL